jgi:hypothetical protein
MHPKSPKWLDDLVDACAYIVEKTTGTDEAAFVADRSLRQVVECNFEIIGEALLQLERTDPTTTARISDYRRSLACATAWSTDMTTSTISESGTSFSMRSRSSKGRQSSSSNKRKKHGSHKIVATA